MSITLSARTADQWSMMAIEVEGTDSIGPSDFTDEFVTSEIWAMIERLRGTGRVITISVTLRPLGWTVGWIIRTVDGESINYDWTPRLHEVA